MLSLCLRPLLRRRHGSQVASTARRFFSAEAIDDPASCLPVSDGPPAAIPSAWKGVQRFYKYVHVAPVAESFGTAYPHLLKRPSASVVATCRLDPVWRVFVDGRELHTNAMNSLLLPTQGLALAIAAEFAAQQGTILPIATPLYNLACTAIDTYAVEDPDEAEATEAFARASRLASMGVPLNASAAAALNDDAPGSSPLHAATAITGRHDSGAMTSASSALAGTSRLRDLLLDFLETDTTCFRIDADAADPSEKLLCKRQARYYDPLLQLWQDAFGVRLAVAHGFGDLAHSDEAYAVAEDFCDTADPFLKAAAASLVGAVKSTAITVALAHRAIDVEAAFQASRVEEEWQIAENGFVEDGHDTARSQARAAIAAASALLWLTPTSAPARTLRPTSASYAAALAFQRQERLLRVSTRRQREAALVAAQRLRMQAADADEAAADAVAAAIGGGGPAGMVSDAPLSSGADAAAVAAARAKLQARAQARAAAAPTGGAGQG